MSKWILLYKADNLIERDALLADLRSEGIEVAVIERPISRKISYGTVDLSYEGVSALFDGFPIQVLEEQEPKAKKIVEDFFRRRNIASAEPDPEMESIAPTYMRKYYMCGFFSTMLPVVFHLYGFYFLVKAIRAGEKISWFKFIFSSLVYVGSACLGYLTVASYFGGRGS